MKLLAKMSLRLAMALLLIVAQVALIVALTSALLLRFPFVSYIGLLVSFLVFLFLLKKEEAYAYKLIWIIIILLLPVVGGIIYMLLGKEHYIRRRTASHIKEHAVIAKLLDNDGELPFVNEVECGRMHSLMKYIRRSSSYHAYENTKTKYYPTGELKFADMLKELEKAENFIFLEYFIVYDGVMWDMLLEVLEKKANLGIEVRLIVDDFGSQKLFTNAYIEELRLKNIQVLRFNPMVPFLLAIMNTRDHRKITVIDGNTAFVGGINISDEYININSPFGTWKDTGVRLKGAAVWSCTLMFIEMWDTFSNTENRIDDYETYKGTKNYKTDGFVLPYGDTPLSRDRVGENIYIEILNQAQKYAYIFTPYLIISEKMTHALQMAAKRGVDVRIIVPGIADKKLVYRLTCSYFTRLLEDGVRIYKYSPGFMHAKSFVSDDSVAVVGTINLDYRSLYLHFENAVLLYNTSSVIDVRNDALKVLGEGREIIFDPTKKYRWTGLLDAFLHLFAPLM